MGVSKDVMILMADGSLKAIKNVNEGDYVINSLMIPSRVISKKRTKEPVIKIELDNGTDVFYISHTQKFLISWKDNNGIKQGMRKVNAVEATDVNLKTTVKFSGITSMKNYPDVKFVLFDDGDINLEEILYEIKLECDNKRYFANGVIIM